MAVYSSRGERGSMYHIAICDDNPKFCCLLENYLEETACELHAHFDVEVFWNAEDFLNDKEQVFDLIFLDINMPDLNGVDFVRTLHERPMVIFTTAYSEYAVEGFRLDAIDYLLKPYSFADFSRSAAKAQSLYELHHRPRTTGPDEETEALPKDREYISVKADYKVSLVRIADIVYLESEGEYVRMHLADSSTITTLFRLKNMEAALPADTFMRVHRSYIVNLRCIKSYVKGRIFLGETEYVPIGENYKEAFQHYIERTYRNL